MNRYSICVLCGTPGARSRAISPGVTQPSAVFVTELPNPTTTSAGVPGTPVTVMVLPSAGPPPPALPSSTTWPGPSGQCPAFSTTSSTGPPGEARPASASCPNGWPWNWVWTTDSANGPAAAVTPAR